MSETKNTDAILTRTYLEALEKRKRRKEERPEATEDAPTTDPDMEDAS